MGFFPDAIFGEAVGAYIQREPDANIDADALIRWCAGELAGYKKPKHVMFVNELPRNSTGKALKTERRQASARRVEGEGRT